MKRLDNRWNMMMLIISLVIVLGISILSSSWYYITGAKLGSGGVRAIGIFIVFMSADASLILWAIIFFFRKVEIISGRDCQKASIINCFMIFFFILQGPFILGEIFFGWKVTYCLLLLLAINLNFLFIKNLTPSDQSDRLFIEIDGNRIIHAKNCLALEDVCVISNEIDTSRLKRTFLLESIWCKIISIENKHSFSAELRDRIKVKIEEEIRKKLEVYKQGYCRACFSSRIRMGEEDGSALIEWGFEFGFDNE